MRMLFYAVLFGCLGCAAAAATIPGNFTVEPWTYKPLPTLEQQIDSLNVRVMTLEFQVEHMLNAMKIMDFTARLQLQMIIALKNGTPISPMRPDTSGVRL